MRRIVALSLFALGMAGCQPQAPAPVDPPARRLSLFCFTEPWCGACRAEKGYQREFAARMAGQVDVLTVSQAESRNFESARALYERYGITGIPAYVLLDRGAEIGRWTGGGHWEEIEAAVQMKLTGDLGPSK